MNNPSPLARCWRLLLIATGSLIVLSLISVVSNKAQASENKTAAVSNTADWRIISGQPVQQFPGIAALVARRQPDAYQGFFCGAVLISKHWLLTAAHCVNKRSAKHTDAIIGRANLGARQGQRHAIQQVVIHPRFKHQGQKLSYDLALLRLARPSTAQPLALISRRPARAGQKLSVAGWGITEYGEMPAQLQQATIYANKQRLCRRIYQTDRSMFCASRQGHDSCQGDSGGPLIGQVGGRTMLFGLVSHGRGCARPGYPGVYARPGLSYNWIKQQSKTVARGKLRLPGRETFPVIPPTDYGPLEYAELSAAVVDDRFDHRRYYRQLALWTRKRFPIKSIQLQFSIPVCRIAKPYDPSIIPEPGACQWTAWRLRATQQRRINFNFYSSTECFSYRAQMSLSQGKTFTITEPSCGS